MTAPLELPEIGDGEDKTSPFKNCIRKKYRHIRKWAKRTQTNCFRIYDRELHHYPFAIDFYAGRFYVQYFSRSRDSDEAPAAMADEVVAVLKELFEATEEAIYWRSRIKRAKMEQYEKVGDFKQFFSVVEYGVKFRVNLMDYLDTGLFLDHRETRQIVAASCKGKRVLNLFAYTCSFSVHAAMAGAIFTKSVDMSNTYTAWGRENFILNSIALRSHPIVRADCLKFLDEESLCDMRYDVIIIDPPTLSRSKKMDQFFDIQLDYIQLLKKAERLLAPEGSIFFSTNLRSFQFDLSLFPEGSIREISEKTLPIDFCDPKIHRCWKITPPTSLKPLPRTHTATLSKRRP